MYSFNASRFLESLEILRNLDELGGEPLGRNVTFAQNVQSGLDLLTVQAELFLKQRIALARLRYSEAARHFANAAAVLHAESTYQDQRIGYLEKEADALYRRGDEFGDNGALLSAIERQRSLLNLLPRERVPLDWAMTQMNLGTALVSLGARESGTDKLNEAVAAYREALKEYTRARVPLQWALTQMNLGTALVSLGENRADPHLKIGGDARRLHGPQPVL